LPRRVYEPLLSRVRKLGGREQRLLEAHYRVDPLFLPRLALERPSERRLADQVATPELERVRGAGPLVEDVDESPEALAVDARVERFVFGPSARNLPLCNAVRE
jgi:hypothetical protein